MSSGSHETLLSKHCCAASGLLVVVRVTLVLVRVVVVTVVLVVVKGSVVTVVVLVDVEASDVEFFVVAMVVVSVGMEV